MKFIHCAIFKYNKFYKELIMVSGVRGSRNAYSPMRSESRGENFDDVEHKDYENPSEDKYGFGGTNFDCEERDVDNSRIRKYDPVHVGRRIKSGTTNGLLLSIRRKLGFLGTSRTKKNKAASVITKFIKSRVEYTKKATADLRSYSESSLRDSKASRNSFEEFLFFTKYRPSQFQITKAARKGFITEGRTYAHFVFVTLIEGSAKYKKKSYDISKFETLEHAPDYAMMAIEGHKNTFITKHGNIPPKEKSRLIEIAFRLSEIEGSDKFLITKLPFTAKLQCGFIDFDLTRKPPIFTLDSFLFDENNQLIEGHTIYFDQFHKLIWGLDKIHEAGLYMGGCITNQEIAIGYKPVETDEVPPLLFANFEKVIGFRDRIDLNNSCPGYTHNGLLNVAKGIHSQINGLLRLRAKCVESLKNMEHRNQTSKIHKKDDGSIESLKNEIRGLEKNIDENRERFIFFLEALDNWSLIMTILKALGVFTDYKIDPKLDEKALSSDNPFERVKHYSCEAIESEFEINKIDIGRKKPFIPEAYSTDDSVKLAQSNEFMAEAYDESNIVRFIRFIDENVKKKYREELFQFFINPVNFLTDYINKNKKMPNLSSMFVVVKPPKRALGTTHRPFRRHNP